MSDPAISRDKWDRFNHVRGRVLRERRAVASDAAASIAASEAVRARRAPEPRALQEVNAMLAARVDGVTDQAGRPHRTAAPLRGKSKGKRRG